MVLTASIQRIEILTTIYVNGDWVYLSADIILENHYDCGNTGLEKVVDDGEVTGLKMFGIVTSLVACNVIFAAMKLKALVKRAWAFAGHV